MSDDETYQSEEEAVEDSGPSEAQIAMQKRREKQKVISSAGLDEEAQEMLESNRHEREKMADEIEELRVRSEKRKRERQEEERQMAQRRAEEEARRKGDEEERRRKKDEEENRKKEERAKKLAEFEKWKNPTTPNFQITKRDRTAESSEEVNPEEEKISKEQLEAEKKAILAQRIQPLNIQGFDSAKLAEKAKDLYNLMFRLESEKYDLEKRFKNQQYDMMELAERARAMNKVGKQGTLKRIQIPENETDKFQERFAGCPSKIEMYSTYERQKDSRTFGNRRDLYTGPLYGKAADRIAAQRAIIWNDEGPVYDSGAEPAPQAPPPEAAPAEAVPAQ